MMDLFPAPVGNMAAVVEDEGQPPRPLPPWNDPEAATSAWRYLDLSGTVKRLLRREDEEAALRGSVESYFADMHASR